MTSPDRATRRKKRHPAAPEAGAPTSGETPAATRPVAGLAIRRRGGAEQDPLGGTAAAPQVTAELDRGRGQGRALPEDVAARFGNALGADLRDVRVHTGDRAHAVAESVQATAFTHGSDLYFSRGSYDPASTSGQHLLAHELTHVVQQRQGQVRPTSTTTIGRADDPLEAEADHSADRVVRSLQRSTAAPDTHQHAPGCGHDRPGSLAGVGIHRSPALAPLLRNKKGKKGGAVNTAQVAPRIAKGHAYAKHVVQEGQFTDLGIDSVDAFAQHIDTVMWEGISRTLKDGRQAYWHQASGTVVIYNPNAVDDGTCFRPHQGKSYYDNLK